MLYLFVLLPFILAGLVRALVYMNNEHNIHLNLDQTRPFIKLKNWFDNV